MMKVALDDVEQLGIGSHFLGSGGGEEFLFTQHVFESQIIKNSVKVVTLNDLSDDALVVPIVCLGNGTVIAEKNYNFSHFIKLIKKIEDICNRKIDVVTALSIGGGTVFSPVFMASYFELPVVDADCAGRCFPQLQMLSTNMADIQPKKAFISNVMGDIIEIQCNNFYNLERHARQAAVSSGGSCLIIPQILTGEEAKRGLIPGTLTKAMTIGQIIQDTRNLDCATACGILSEYTKGTFVGIGGIVSHEGCLNLPRPFKRRIVLKNIEEGRVWEVWMDDEFNLLFENGKIIAEVPDIITLCDMNTREPLTIRQLHVHRNIAICTMKAPDIWYTEKGMALVRTKQHIKGRNDICGLDACAPTHITKNCA